MRPVESILKVGEVGIEEKYEGVNSTRIYWQELL
jgi:hypothetical protein